MHVSRPLLLIIALAAGLPAQTAAQDVTVYRCVARDGAVSLRDSPCPPGQSQDTRNMQRPRDPAPTTAPPPVPAAAPTSTPPPTSQVVYREPPRPMYECIDPDGQRYTSDNDEGNPRWVPFWTWAPAAVWPHSSHRPAPPPLQRPPSHGSPPPRPHPAPHPRPPVPPAQGVVLPAGGTWVRDECRRLPQREICTRLSNRRYDILRRYHSATQSERRNLDLEQQDIDSRMANDCGRL